MATVRVTDNLRHLILCNVNQMFEKDINELRAFPSLPPNFVADCAAILFPESLLWKLRDLPYNIIDWANSVDFEVEYNASFKHDGQPVNVQTYSFSHKARNPIYPKTRYHSGPAPKVTYDMSYKHCALLTQAINARDAKIQEQADARYAVSKILSECSTIKRFLEAFPAGERFVPEDAMARHNHRSTVKRSAPEKIDIVEKLGSETIAALNQTISQDVFKNLGAL